MKRSYVQILISIGLLSILYILFNPAYHTNDDNQWIWMLEGIGANAKAPPTPFTVYQHFLLGYIYQLLPDFLDIFGYNWMHILSQVIFLYASIKFIQSNKTYNIYVAIFYANALSLINFFLPQYSVTPILLVAAAIIFLMKSKRLFDINSIFSMVLILWSSMIRIEPFIFSVITLIPYVLKFNSTLVRKKSFFIGVGVSIIFSLINYNVTKSSNASGFFYKDLDRKIILDYKGRDYFYKNPQELKGTGLTINDLKFFGHWLLLDPEINKKVLNKNTIQKIHFSLRERFNWGVDSLLFFYKNKNLRYLSIVFLITILCAKNLTSLISAGIFFLAVFYSGYLGREQLIRVYIGPLVVLSLFNIGFVNLNKKRSIYIIFSICLFLFLTIKPLAHRTLWKEKTAKERLSWLIDKSEGISTDIIWWPFATAYGDDFYRIKNLPNIRELEFVRPNYNWGDASDPMATKRHQKFNHDFSSKGVSLVLDSVSIFDRYRSIFTTYCQEHFSGNLKETYQTKKDQSISIVTLQCQN